jgi:hypothetical protein
MSVVKLVEKFMAHKPTTGYLQTLIKYDATLQRLKDFLGQKGVEGASDNDGTPLVYHPFTSVKMLDFAAFSGIESYLGKGEVMSSILIAGFS